ncbi:MAG: NAD-dependent malic enzyme [Planctomycetes bacterium]|nr:NAD-dependent malic enzyme [Planctomycetota bacterium]
MDHDLAPGFRLRRDPTTGDRWIECSLEGADLENAPILNKGTGFSQDERDAFGLTGLLPPRCVTMGEQSERVFANYRAQTTDLARYAALQALMDRNETLYYRLLVDHLEEMLPIVYTPTVGQACQQFGRLYRRGRGVYFTPETTIAVDRILRRWRYSDVRVVVVTDGERVLGLGDLGAGGMGISIGKISLYVAGAGIHPARTLPVCLDVGTNNARLLDDPLYLGTKRERVRGDAYDALVDAFVHGIRERWPKAMIQFEDFAMGNALRLLDRYRSDFCCFNDDIQGTGAVTAAGVLAGLRLTGQKMEDLRVLIAGAGGAGIGIARALRGARIWMCDVDGLLTTSRANLVPEQRPFAVDDAPATLAEAAVRVRPHVLIGVTGKAGTFTQEMVSAMDGPRPMVFPLSNPTSCVECTPDQAREWTGGRAIVATGSPFPGTSQCNNVYIFPGIGLGVTACDASRVTDAMVRAAAETLAAMAPISDGGSLYPPIRDIRLVSREVAFAVARRAMDDGVAAPQTDDALRTRIADEVWEPAYVPYRRPRDPIAAV